MEEAALEQLEKQQDVQHLIWTSIQEKRQSVSRLTGNKKQHNVLEEKRVSSA